jgi:hypothetical protein
LGYECIWRDASGHEIDLLIEHNDKIGIAEIKATATLKCDDFKGLNYFAALEGSNVKSKNLIYTGVLNQKRSQANITSWNKAEDILK